MVLKGEASVRVRAILPYLSQPKDGYRYATDAVVLGAFAAQKPTQHWIDLGTGCGVLAFKLNKTWPSSRGFAIERSPRAISHARLNLRALPVSVVQGDLRTFPYRPQFFDLAVCNPPFFDAHAFRKSLNPSIRNARHALQGDITAFAMAIKPALKPTARFCFVFPLDLVDKKIAGLLELGFYLWRKLEFSSFAEKQPHGICLEFGLEPRKVLEKHLILYQKPGFYTGEAWQFLTSEEVDTIT